MIHFTSKSVVILAPHPPANRTTELGRGFDAHEVKGRKRHIVLYNGIPLGVKVTDAMSVIIESQ